MPSADAARRADRWKRAAGVANPGLERGRFGGVFDAPAAAGAGARVAARATRRPRTTSRRWTDRARVVERFGTPHERVLVDRALRARAGDGDAVARERPRGGGGLRARRC